MQHPHLQVSVVAVCLLQVQVLLGEIVIVFVMRVQETQYQDTGKEQAKTQMILRARSLINIENANYLNKSSCC